MKYERLKTLRTSRGLTQKELCEKLKDFDCYIAQNTYSQYETGKHVLPAEVLIKLCLFYKISADYILVLK